VLAVAAAPYSLEELKLSMRTMMMIYLEWMKKEMILICPFGCL